ncbi:hypothetical protein EAG_08298 [Camponotus floridanus]|uniref:Uncharacterized protein n=1 Tax=Camponotus floridanus TaxID=104421 RepID=E2APJ9_CAMFO|nr:hypothetical protein EAG_08298 [Camponotus floridanus]
MAQVNLVPVDYSTCQSDEGLGGESRRHVRYVFRIHVHLGKHRTLRCVFSFVWANAKKTSRWHPIKFLLGKARFHADDRRSTSARKPGTPEYYTRDYNRQAARLQRIIARDIQRFDASLKLATKGQASSMEPLGNWSFVLLFARMEEQDVSRFAVRERNETARKSSRKS